MRTRKQPGCHSATRLFRRYKPADRWGPREVGVVVPDEGRPPFFVLRPLHPTVLFYYLVFVERRSLECYFVLKMARTVRCLLREVVHEGAGVVRRPEKVLVMTQWDGWGPYENSRPGRARY